MENKIFSTEQPKDCSLENTPTKDELPLPDIEVWIASHLHSQQRFEWAKEMLLSLSYQTDKDFTVRISWSKENYIQGDLSNLACDILGKQDPDNKVILYCYEHENIRLTQFEHIKYIYKIKEIGRINSTETGPTFILFLDDDDMYHQSRVEKIKNIIKQYPDTQFFRDQYINIRGGETIDTTIRESLEWNEDCHSDFGNNICDYQLINKFFTEALNENYVKENPNIQGLLDCVLSAWLKGSYITKNTMIKEVLYFYRKELSIPGRICWDRNKNFKLGEKVNEWKLKEVFFEMSMK